MSLIVSPNGILDNSGFDIAAVRNTAYEGANSYER